MHFKCKKKKKLFTVIPELRKRKKTPYKKREILISQKKVTFFRSYIMFCCTDPIHKSLQTDLHCFRKFLNNSPLHWASDMKHKFPFNLWYRWRPESLLKMVPATQFPIWASKKMNYFENAWPDHTTIVSHKLHHFLPKKGREQIASSRYGEKMSQQNMCMFHVSISCQLPICNDTLIPGWGDESIFASKSKSTTLLNKLH